MMQHLHLNAEDRAYLNHVDVTFGYDLALKLGEFRTNEVLGFRPAGSHAEHAARDYLQNLMQEIGLQNIEQYEFPVVGWDFKHAKLFVDDSVFELGAYQCDFVTKGQQAFDIIEAGRGTYHEIKTMDVRGKFLLIDVNQREDWWVNFPAHEAFFAQAAGIILVQQGGYGNISDDALNTQDAMIPAGLAALSMSRNQAKVVRQKMVNGQVRLEMDIHSTLDRAAKSYNVYGEITGLDPNAQRVLMTAHYDAYFTGFQDNSAAVAIMLGIAKALIDSGYQPKRTLVFGALGAEEWGLEGKRYDWLVGSQMQMTQLTPHWAQETFANINFELPAMLEGDSDWIRTSYELETFMKEFVKRVPNDGTVYPNGIEVITPIQTWSDDFAFEIAGIPSSVTALRPEFSKSHYHSQFDDVDTYHEGAFTFHHYLYGLLVIAYDRLNVQPLDFGVRLQAMEASFDPTCYDASSADVVNFKAALAEAKDVAAALYQTIVSQNQDDQSSLGDDTILFKAFKYGVDHFVKLDWSDGNLFAYEHYQNNIKNLNHILDHHQAQNHSAMDAAIKAIDSNAYAFDWSRASYDLYTDKVIGAGDDKMWGTGRVMGHLDLFDLVQNRKTIGSKALKLEIQQHLDQQRAALATCLHQEIEHVTTWTRLMRDANRALTA